MPSQSSVNAREPLAPGAVFSRREALQDYIYMDGESVPPEEPPEEE